MSVQQNEFSSFKLLLKNVYSVHTSKVRELENEVKVLKEKLVEKVREPANVSDCKRCAELEEAFKSCKKALHEQSKWFESFGQKFSIFNGTEPASQDLKIPTQMNKTEADEIARNMKTEITYCDKNEDFMSVEENISNKNNIENVSKDLTSNNQNLFKKVMFDDGGLNSFDLCTVTFPQNVKHDELNIKSGLAVLAPDSLDIDHIDTKKGVKRASTDCLPEKDNIKKVSNSKESEKCEKNRMTSKRLSSESLKENKSECCDNNQMKKHSVAKSIKIEADKTVIGKYVANGKSKDKVSSKMLSDSLNEDDPKRCPQKNTFIDSDVTKSVLKTPEETKIQKSVLPDVGNKYVTRGKMKENIKDSEENLEIPKQKNDVLRVVTSVENKTNIIPKGSLSLNSITDVKKVNSPYETSPSLLPICTNLPAPKIIDLESMTNDNEDFVESTSNNKPLSTEDSWNTCDKRKTFRKKPILKSVKSTSKYKMTLDAPPLNYKKPNFKQVKLSKSFFQGKHKDNSKDKLMEKSSITENESSPKRTEKDTFSTFILDDFETPAPSDDAKPHTPADIDATFIPENYKYEVTPCGTSAVKRNAVEKSHLRNGSLFANISFPGELKSVLKYENSDIEEGQDSESFEDVEVKENVDSFDRLPVPEEPNYKYKNDVVRKKSERKQLNAFDCKECEKYYSELGISNKEKQERMKKCSRHRAKFAAPATPAYFWELDFPDTQECKARGYMNETQKVKLHNLCDI